MKTPRHGVYYRNTLCTVQITRETSTNMHLHFIKPVVTGYSYKKKPVFNALALIFLQVFLVVFFQKNLRWIINLLLDLLVYNIAVYFYTLFVF